MSHFIECQGDNRNRCTIGVNGDFPISGPPFYITALFEGNGPFQVQWLLNGTEYDCRKSPPCIGINPDSKSVENFQVSVSPLLVCIC